MDVHVQSNINKLYLLERVKMLTKHKKKKSSHRIKLKINDRRIQQEWCSAIEKMLYRFTNVCSLRNIASFITNVHFGNMSPFLVNEILRMATPACGIQLALNVMIETMKDICEEASNELLMEFSTPANIPKESIAVTLLCETLTMPTVTYDQLSVDEELAKSTPLQIQHILKNDRERGWLKQYTEARQESINVFTVRLGPGNIKATPTTGKYIFSVLMPYVTPHYTFLPSHVPHSTNFEDLMHKYKNAVVELTAHQRMAKNIAKGKNTPYDEVLIAARQIHHEKLQKLEHRVRDQENHNNNMIRQYNELKQVLRERELKKIGSLEETIVVLFHKLNQSRAQIVNLRKELRLKRDRETLEGDILKTKSEDDVVFKKQKLLHGYIKSSPTVSSYSNESENEDANYSDSFDDQYDDDEDEDDESQ